MVVEVIFEVYEPGSGRIIVEPRDKVTEDVITSIKYAIVLSSIIVGFNYTLYDYRYVFRTNFKVEGLSATLGFVLGFLGFLRNESTVNFAATGLVSPYGTIGLVSGIGAKYIAARGRGLSLVIGPIYGVNWTSYRGVPDIFTAYRTAYKHSLLTSISNDSFPETNLTNIYNRAFNESTIELYGLINNTIEKLVELGIDYTSNDGFRLLNYSLKHYRKGRYYTASSYAFRSYYTLYSLYLDALRRLDNVEYNIVVRNEVDSLLRDIMNLTSIIKQYSSSSKNIDLWNLDVLMNSYERINIALNLLTQFINSGYIDTNSLALSKARVVTAKQWLKLFRSMSNESEYVLNSSTIEKTKLLLKTYCSLCNEYLSYVFPGLGWGVIDCSSIDMEGVLGLIEFNQQLNTIYRVFETGVSRSIYEEYYGLGDIYELMKTIREITLYLYENTHQQIPSLISVMELTNSYIEDGENISMVAYMLTSNIPSAVIHIVLVNSSKNNTWIITPPLNTTKTQEHVEISLGLTHRVPIVTILLIFLTALLSSLIIIIYVIVRSSRE
ncbi:MAG: hypothetical protein QXO14_04070 [Desulfurococcaceae archaeon]